MDLFKVAFLLSSLCVVIFAADVWSIGVVLAEFLLRFLPFRGSDTKEQLRLIVEALGTPSDEDLCRTSMKSKKALQYIRSLPSSPRRPMSLVLKSLVDAAAAQGHSSEISLVASASVGQVDDEAANNEKSLYELALDLLGKMLELNPDKRITAREAISHPLFNNDISKLHEPDDEPDHPLMSAADGQRTDTIKTITKAFDFERIREGGEGVATLLRDIRNEMHDNMD